MRIVLGVFMLLGGYAQAQQCQERQCPRGFEFDQQACDCVRVCAPPTVDAGRDLQSCTGNITLDGTGSSVGCNSAGFKWFNEDGRQVGRGFNPTVRGLDRGDHVFTLRVCDVTGQCGEDTVTVTVGDIGPWRYAREVPVTQAYNRMYCDTYLENEQCGLIALLEDRGADMEEVWDASVIETVHVLAYDSSVRGRLMLQPLPDGEPLVIYDPGAWGGPSRGWLPEVDSVPVNIPGVLIEAGYEPETPYRFLVGRTVMNASNTHRIMGAEPGEMLFGYNDGGIGRGDKDANEPVFIAMGPRRDVAEMCPVDSVIIIGTHEDDVLTGTNGNDCIIGLGGDDLIRGRAGDDVIIGGRGSDDVRAGAGNDLVYGNSCNDRLLGQRGEDALLGGEGDDNIRGGRDADILFGGPGNDTASGGSGDDEVHGEDGDDRVIGGWGADRLDGGDGDDYISGGSGNDVITGGFGSNDIRGGRDDDDITAGPADDRIRGGSGNDMIIAGSGDDDVRGNSGDDEIQGGSGNDRIHGGGGNDRVFAGRGDDDVNGGSGDDELHGQSGDDDLNGASGTDILRGGTGNDMCRNGENVAGCEG